MSAVSAATLPVSLESRARQSRGTSHDAIYRMVREAVDRHAVARGRLVDVGCGTGTLFQVLGIQFRSYCGLDAVRYEAFPAAAGFHQVDLDAPAWPEPASTADVVVAVETIEHLENPWAFMRQLAALAVPGGLVIVTTPNQLSLLSLVTLLVKRRFSAFQDVHYPAHRTALLESDLRRAAEASGLDVLDVVYSRHGRIPFTAWHYPRVVAACLPRWCSDNLMIVARRARG
ncbi:MAG: class I SAM-dependent methyltransferase [Vicinamibacterales bacterium]